MRKFCLSKDLAMFLKCSDASIVQWRKKGMPAVRTGLQRYEYDLDEVLTWLVNQGENQREYVTNLLEAMKKKKK